MTRTALRHTLSVLAALALVSAFASSQASAQFDSQINNMMNNNLQMLPAQSKTKGQSAEGLAMKSGQEPTSPDLSRDYQARSNILKTK